MRAFLREFVRNRLPGLTVALGRLGRELREMKRGPILVDFRFDIVHGCQFRWVGCPNSTRLPKIQRVTVEHFSRCLANVNVSHVKRFAFFNYGDPLLHPELPALVAVLPRQRWTTEVVEISTNAQNINWGRWEETIKLKVITHFAISCDGDGTPEDYERLRPPAKWTKLMECFEKWSRLRDRLHPELKIFTRTLIRTRSDRLRWEETLRPFRITPEFRGGMNLAEASTLPHGEQLNVGCGVCYWMSNIPTLYATSNGDVVPCCAPPRAGVLGNLLCPTYIEIRSGELHRDFRYQLEHNRAAMEICGRCEAGPDGIPGIILGPEILS